MGPGSGSQLILSPLLLLAMVNVAKAYAWLGVNSSTSSSADLVTSPVFSPLLLACIRLTLAIYALTTSIIVLAHDSITSSKHDAGGCVHFIDQFDHWILNVSDTLYSFFSYFTQLSYMGLLAYFWASGVQTLVYALRRHKSYPLQTWPRFLQFLHRLLYSSITTFRTSCFKKKAMMEVIDEGLMTAILVTIVYWTLLSSSDTFKTRFSC
jgi:hypothetical protein